MWKHAEENNTSKDLLLDRASPQHWTYPIFNMQPDVASVLACTASLLAVIVWLRHRGAAAADGDRTCVGGGCEVPGLASLPGPRGLPVFGNLLQLWPKPFLAWTRTMWPRYGDVFRVWFGSVPVVVVCGARAFREAFIRQNDAFGDRPPLPSSGLVADGFNLTANRSSETWKLQRKLTCQALLALLSHERRPVDVLVAQKTNELIEKLSANTDLLVEPSVSVRETVAGIMFDMMFGGREDGDVGTVEFGKKVLHHIEVFMKIMPQVQLHDLSPSVAKILVPNAMTKAQGITRHITNLFKKMMEANLHSYDGVVRNTADAFIDTAQRHGVHDAKSATSHPSGLTREHYFSGMEDLIGAGNDTMSGTLIFIIRYLARYPEVQRKVYEELQTVIGESAVTWEHKASLTYTEATLHEILRHACPMPMTIPHGTSQEAWLRGHYIPKDTLVVGNIHSVAHDPSLWEKPDSFQPERFINEDGAFDHIKADRTAVFGVGKRRCAGKGLALRVIFLLYANLVQNLQFTEDLAEPIVEEEVYKLTLAPAPYKVRVIRR